jgi:hypothetical protein
LLIPERPPNIDEKLDTTTILPRGGTRKEWSGVMVYCTVDPKAQDISYYKEVYDEPPSFLRKSMSVLSRLFE